MGHFNLSYSMRAENQGCDQRLHGYGDAVRGGVVPLLISTTSTFVDFATTPSLKLRLHPRTMNGKLLYPSLRQ